MRKSLQFKATTVASGEELGALLVRVGGKRQVVADLGLGAWTPHALPVQILGQLLGKDVAHKTQSAKTSVAMSLGDSMSAGIDQEGRGNRALLTAYQNARQIGTLLLQQQASAVIVAPAFGIAWRYEDQLLVEYLVSLFPEVELHFAVLAGSTPVWPKDWSVELAAGGNAQAVTQGESLLARLPGAVGPAALAACPAAERGALFELGNGWAVVRPEWRRAPAPGTFTRAEVAALPALGLRNLAGYALYHSTHLADDCWAFCQEAWRQFDAGYRELGFFFIEVARETAAEESNKAIFACHRQAMHLASAHYTDAGSSLEPMTALPEQMRGFLLETKGWGLVMANRPAEALPHLHAALGLCEPEVPDVPYLFLLNITALAEVRSGNFDAAFALEKKIERLIVEHGLDDARLQFVNWLNLARLARYAKDLDGAERYYALAFSTVEGARTETDCINANLCNERIEHARGNLRAALMCWVRAAMHWCASECPEALNWRIQNLILGKPGRVDPSGTAEIVLMVEELAAATLARLKGAAEACGLSIEADATKARPFHFHGDVKSSVKARRYVGGAGWAVMLGEGAPAKQQYGAQYDALVAWLGAWVGQANAGDSGCYLVDRGHGGEMPLDWEQMLSSAIECGVSDLVFEGNPVALDLAVMQSLSQERKVVPNPIVARVDESGERTVVHFKRYFQPYALVDEERVLLQASAGAGSIADLKAHLRGADWNEEKVERTLEGLRRRSIVQVSFAAQAQQSAALASRAA